jgi:cyanate permease
MEFEPADVATVVALSVAINQGTLAFGPAAFGALYDVTGGYLVPFILAALADVVAGVTLLAAFPGCAGYIPRSSAPFCGRAKLR